MILRSPLFFFFLLVDSFLPLSIVWALVVVLELDCAGSAWVPAFTSFTWVGGGNGALALPVLSGPCCGGFASAGLLLGTVVVSTELLVVAAPAVAAEPVAAV